MKKNKKIKKFTHEELLGDAFVVRVTESRVDIETVNKMWKTVFDKTTAVYSYVIWLITNKHLEELHIIVASLFSCSRITLNTEMLNAVMETMDEVSTRQAEEAAKKLPDVETEEDILKSEQILHESIEEIANNANVVAK